MTDSWTTTPADTRGALVAAATAYAAGRRTYVTDAVAQAALREWPSMDDADRAFIAAWLRARQSLGDRCDETAWQQVLTAADGSTAPARTATFSKVDLHIVVFCAARAFTDAHLPSAGGPSLDRVAEAFQRVAPLLSEQERASTHEELRKAGLTPLADALRIT